MTELSNGKIYCLICNISGKKYYGSTTQTLMKRKDNLITVRTFCPTTTAESH